MLTVLTNFKILLGVMVGGRRPMVEDDLWWKTTFGGRRTSVEGNLRWKTTFSGRQPSMKDNLWWNMTLGGRWPYLKDNFWGKTTSGWRLLINENKNKNDDKKIKMNSLLAHTLYHIRCAAYHFCLPQYKNNKQVFSNLTWATWKIEKIASPVMGGTSSLSCVITRCDDMWLIIGN